MAKSKPVKNNDVTLYIIVIFDIFHMNVVSNVMRYILRDWDEILLNVPSIISDVAFRGVQFLIGAMNEGNR